MRLACPTTYEPSSLLDYELVAALSEIYHQQATAVELFGRAVDRYELALFEPGRQKETVQAFHWMTVELVTLEDGLRERYVEYLSRPPAGAH